MILLSLGSSFISLRGKAEGRFSREGCCEITGNHIKSQRNHTENAYSPGFAAICDGCDGFLTSSVLLIVFFFFLFVSALAVDVGV